MDSEANKRQRGNSITAANGSISSSTTNDTGSMPQVVNGSSMDMNLNQTYNVDSQKNKSVEGNPSPRNQRFAPPSSTTENTPSSRAREQTRSGEPPVTKATLSELDVNKIVNNPKLRHDINFDPDLHFRPNLDGEKGRRKTQKANDFWDTMRRQLETYLMHREQFEQDIGGAEWCLPATLNAVRGILESLVPQRERASVEETFNVELLMQQFRMGVADLVKLSTWVSQLLKCHCAPMRDNWVDEMVTQLSNGDRNGDVDLLVAGMQNLLGVLEAMKLDVANHQIRCLRPLLIEDTVHFEQKFFMKKIAMGRVDVAGAHSWFKSANSLPDVVLLNTSSPSRRNTWDFMTALVNLTLPSRSSEMVPHTFLFDEERLVKLRADMLDLINLDICMSLYRTWQAPSMIIEQPRIVFADTASTSFDSSPCKRPTSPAHEGQLSSPTLPSEHDFRSIKSQETKRSTHSLSGQAWTSNLDDEMTHSSGSSARSSPASIASTMESSNPTPLYLSQPLTDTAAQVRASLVAILSSSNPADKWSSLSSSIALQILRSTTTPLSHLPQFESQLARRLSNCPPTVYQEAEARVLKLMWPVLQKLVDQYTPLSSLQIFESATAPKAATKGVATPPLGVKEEISEVATRIAHIGILHWRVWAPLAYLVDPDAEEDSDSSERAQSMA